MESIPCPEKALWGAPMPGASAIQVHLHMDEEHDYRIVCDALTLVFTATEKKALAAYERVIRQTTKREGKLASLYKDGVLVRRMVVERGRFVQKVFTT